MPELPEVETVTRGMARMIEGHTIARVKTNRPDLRVPFPDNMNERLAGRAVLSCRRRAKYSLVDLEGDLTLILHLGMSGRISLLSATEEYEPAKHDHMIVSFVDKRRLVFNDPRRFGMVMLTETPDLAAHKSFAHLGPEPLSGDFTGAYLQTRLAGRTAAIKNIMLDQRIVVGIGNIYICEALFRAGIDPRRAAGSLSDKEAAALVGALKSVLREAIAAGGSSLKDYRKADGELGYFQHNFAVYGREGEICPGCTCDIDKTDGIKRIVQAGRSTFFCPRKQE